MTSDEIKELAGHREVPPWVMKLVADAVAMEREQCKKIAESMSLTEANMNKTWRTACRDVAEAINERGNP